MRLDSDDRVRAPQVGEQGGPAGIQPPHAFAVYYRDGGCGTFLPLFFCALQRAREAAPRGETPPEPRDLRAAAYLDPNAPTVLFVPSEQDDAGGGADVDAPEAYPRE